MAIPLIAAALAALVEAAEVTLVVCAAVLTAIGLNEMIAADEEADKLEEGNPASSTDACSTCPPPDDEEDPEEKTKADPIKDQEKLERQMRQRDWTHDQIRQAIENGERFPVRNYKTGGSATRYVHPETGRSVIIDDTTGGVIQVGGDGFKFPSFK